MRHHSSGAPPGIRQAKAMKILKQKMSKEGILQEIKRLRYHEKPSVKRKRKIREARKRRRREAKRRVIR